jgi:hypothetical protein
MVGRPRKTIHGAFLGLSRPERHLRPAATPSAASLGRSPGSPAGALGKGAGPPRKTPWRTFLGLADRKGVRNRPLARVRPVRRSYTARPLSSEWLSPAPVFSTTALLSLLAPERPSAFIGNRRPHRSRTGRQSVGRANSRQKDCAQSAAGLGPSPSATPLPTTSLSNSNDTATLGSCRRKRRRKWDRRRARTPTRKTILQFQTTLPKNL